MLGFVFPLGQIFSFQLSTLIVNKSRLTVNLSLQESDKLHDKIDSLSPATLCLCLTCLSRR